MAEIKRPPVKIIVGETEYEAFDEDHTHADIVRWVLSMEQADAEELGSMLNQALAGEWPA